jgi:AcrR family transcriptional regulator
MNWFEAILAFALSMIVFSTMVTVMVEITYRFWRRREKIFKEMVERLFNQVLWPLLRERLAQADVTTLRQNFVDALTLNNAAFDPGAPSRSKGLRRIDNSKMTALEFAERLAGTEVGKTIAAEAKDRIDAVINDLAQKYVRFCDGARTLLAERSLSFSLALSIVLAFALNINAVVLFRSFVQDEKLRSGVIERQATIERDFKAAQAALERAKGQTIAQDDQQEIEKRIKELRDQVGDLTAIGLPIGYENFPGCTKPRPSVDIGDCKAGTVLQYVAWALSVLLGGLLIGLGAPFWFDVAQGLSKSLQVLKAVGGRVREKEEAGPAAAVGASPPPRTPVEAFRTAIDALPAGELRRLKLS